jgi:hypothetical protein
MRTIGSVDNVTNDRGPEDHDYWRRPAEGAETAKPQEQPKEPEPYTGPPTSTPPPKGWRPPVVVPTPPPREMPSQDQDAMDASERSTRVVTYGVGIFAAAVVLVLVFIVCARLVS